MAHGRDEPIMMSHQRSQIADPDWASHSLAWPGRISLKGYADTGAIMSPTVDVQAEPPHQITFGKGCDAVEGLPVVSTLRRMADSVTHITGAFAADFG